MLGLTKYHTFFVHKFVLLLFGLIFLFIWYLVIYVTLIIVYEIIIILVKIQQSVKFLLCSEFKN